MIEEKEDFEESLQQPNKLAHKLKQFEGAEFLNSSGSENRIITNKERLLRMRYDYPNVQILTVPDFNKNIQLVGAANVEVLLPNDIAFLMISYGTGQDEFLFSFNGIPRLSTAIQTQGSVVNLNDPSNNALEGGKLPLDIVFDAKGINFIGILGFASNFLGVVTIMGWRQPE